MLVLAGIGVSAFGAFYTLDVLLAGSDATGFFDFAPDRITDSIGSLSGIIAAVLGIIVTVVSIIVQLSAERFAHVTEMFFRERTNRVVLGFYVIGCIWGIFVSFSLGEHFVPRVSLVVMMVVALVGFCLMAPYFAYVFDFLRPSNIIARIQQWGIDGAALGTRAHDGARAAAQAQVVDALEQLADITVNAIHSKDKIIATAAVDALKDLAIRTLELKRGAHPDWFKIGDRIRKNPDLLGLAPESVTDLERRRVWLEWKVLRQYQSIYSEALTAMRDVDYVCAIDTRYIAEAALKAGDDEVVGLGLKFMNTFLRATINARDVRTCYNVLNQYRQLAEAVASAGGRERVIEIANYLKYYGHVAFSAKLAFVTETSAHDLCALCEHVHDALPEVERTLLGIFLEVDQAADDAAQEANLRGVRKAQVKLATFYLVRGREDLARVIFDDMKKERPERLRSIRDELERVESKDFWEVVDRGTNFDYLTPERKAVLASFFAWFGPAAVATVRSPTIPYEPA